MNMDEQMGEEYRDISTRIFPGDRNNVRGCARCGEDHPPLDVVAFWRPFEDADGVWRWWATCPTTGDPILISNAEDLTDEATDRLSESHFIKFSPLGWTIKHPLSCRPNLFECDSTEHVSRMVGDESPVGLGVFALVKNDGGEWEIVTED